MLMSRWGKYGIVFSAQEVKVVSTLLALNMTLIGTF